MNSYVDLHMHSIASDGTDLIPGLLQKIQETGIKTFALTDHDTIKGVLEMQDIVPEGITFIRGVELSCKTKIAKCHILGYNYDTENKEFRAFVEEAHDVRKDKFERRIRYLKETFDIEFTEEEMAELKKDNSPGKPQLAGMLLKKMKPDQPELTVDDIFKTYLKNLPSGRVDGIRAVKAIIAAGGVAVWAHPLGGVREKRLDAEKFSKQLRVLIDAGIRGLECYYSEYTMEEVEKLCSAAKEHGLLISGGSDYHGTGKPHLHLGMLNKEDKIIEEEKLTVLDVLN